MSISKIDQIIDELNQFPEKLLEEIFDHVKNLTVFSVITIQRQLRNKNKRSKTTLGDLC